MTLTRKEKEEWISQAGSMRTSFLIIVCDTFDWDDYPVYVMPGQDIKERFDHFNNKNMQKIIEIFEFSSEGKLSKSYSCTEFEHKIKTTLKQ